MKAEPENMEVTGYVRSSTGSNTDVMLCGRHGEKARELDARG